MCQQTEEEIYTINKASLERGDAVCLSEGEAVHEVCRRNYTNARNIQSVLKKKAEKENALSNLAQNLRSQKECFDFAKCCLFCGKEANLDSRSGPKVYPVRTLDFERTIFQVCSQRCDEWADIVRSRLEFVSDLPAADAVYHQNCSLCFRSRKRPPQFTQSHQGNKQVKLGRPKDERKAEAFEKVATYLVQNENEQITVNDLIIKMKEFTDDAYSHPTMKQELQNYFGEQLIVTEVNGKSNVVTFRKTASSSLHNFYAKKVKDEDAQKELILKTAAELLKNDIRAVPTSRAMYPSDDDISSRGAKLEFVPKSLQILLENIFSGKETSVKVSSIGQAIMQASRPRLLLCPLQIGLAVQMHHCFDSKFLIDTLYSLGFCSSYKEVLTYEMNAAVSENNVAFQVDGHFTQYIADNLDHNTATLDGCNTFHGMGMIATVTPTIGKTDRIRRRTDVKPEEIVKRAKVDIQYYNRQACDGLLKLKFEHLENVFVEDVTSKVDLLWKACWLLQPDRPSWSGFMQAIHKGRYPGQSSIIFMPMIDMNPSDTTCIFSTLHFISAQAKRSNTTPVLTFDQPLWWKALGIISSEPDGSDLKAWPLSFALDPSIWK